MCRKNGFPLAVAQANEWIQTHDIITIDIQNAFNTVPFEAILNGLIKNNIDGTLITYIMYML